MRATIVKALVFALTMGGVYYLLRVVFHTEAFFPEASAISGFLTMFGALYGILTAFVVFEVWKQYNVLSELIDKEAQSLEQLYGLVLYFRDSKLTTEMKAAIQEYAGLIIEGQFHQLGLRERSAKTAQVFDRIAELIRHIHFNDDHDAAVFNQVLEHYRELAQTRSERLNKSLRRLPILLKSFIYIASLLTLLTFSFMPFATPYYGVLAMLIISFQLAMIYFIIEGLDNPFVGHWRLTPEPFARALQHIEGHY